MTIHAATGCGQVQPDETVIYIGDTDGVDCPVCLRLIAEARARDIRLLKRDMEARWAEFLAASEAYQNAIKQVAPTPDPFPPSRNWKVGERFAVPGFSGSYPDHTKTRYGTIVGFRPSTYTKEHLVVRLDDEDKDRESFNPDIIRHLREGEQS